MADRDREVEEAGERAGVKAVNHEVNDEGTHCVRCGEDIELTGFRCYPKPDKSALNPSAAWPFPKKDVRRV